MRQDIAERNVRIRELLSQGVGVRAIARTLGCHHASVIRLRDNAIYNKARKRARRALSALRLYFGATGVEVRDGTCPECHRRHLLFAASGFCVECDFRVLMREEYPVLSRHPEFTNAAQPPS